MPKAANRSGLTQALAPMTSRATERPPDYSLNISAYSDADDLFHCGRYKEALALFRNSADADPEDGDCWIAIGSCHDALKQPARAEAAYRKAMTLCEPEWHPALHFNMGNSCFDRGMYALAIQHYLRVPRGHKAWPDAERNRKLALMQQAGR
ncbi:tetratricopeptide repeat protein [Thermomonas carbonis]|uniref:Tetratricopeptide repeat protein n=2 Tax=Thermomonas carbonis TaxID=1463158 RepID=A0A7G9SNM4_9GAMM|nr:tetratricopeptide repeat protein [Thermomonas carbonis]QNN69449.1 tetratricopeptide repeat protein [Thermomonas carbonis]